MRTSLNTLGYIKKDENQHLYADYGNFNLKIDTLMINVWEHLLAKYTPIFFLVDFLGCILICNDAKSCEMVKKEENQNTKV